jgi:hypothetical protein
MHLRRTDVEVEDEVVIEVIEVGCGSEIGCGWLWLAVAGPKKGAGMTRRHSIMQEQAIRRRKQLAKNGTTIKL